MLARALPSTTFGAKVPCGHLRRFDRGTFRLPAADAGGGKPIKFETP